MILRTGTTLRSLPRLSTITGFGTGRHFAVRYPRVELLAEDVEAGVTLVSAVLVIAAAFGSALALVTKAISLAPNPQVGQVTDAGADGVGALYFALSPDDTALCTPARAFEVVVVDSRGQETTLDAGSIVASATAIGSVTVDTDVDSIELTPERAAAIVTHGFGLTAQVLDEDGNPLLGRTIAWATNNAAIATVDSGGLVTPVGTGSAIITATVDGVIGSAFVTVERLTIGSDVRIGGVTP